MVWCIAGFNLGQKRTSYQEAEVMCQLGRLTVGIVGYERLVGWEQPADPHQRLYGCAPRESKREFRHGNGEKVRKNTGGNRYQTSEHKAKWLAGSTLTPLQMEVAVATRYITQGKQT